MLSLNGNTLLFMLFLAVLVVVQGNFAHSTFNCKDELDGQWRKTEPFNLEFPDIDPVAIFKLFPGLFHTETELMAIEKQEDAFRKQRLSFETEDFKEILSLPGDGSMCCVTKLERFANATLTNMQGEKRNVVKLIVNGKEQVQSIPHGRCIPDIDPVAIIKLFPGLFHTETELIAIEKQEDAFRKQRLSFETEDYKEILSLPGDGSMCCVTKHDLFPNSTLKNLQGQLQHMVKLIVHGAEQLQYIPHGRCMEGGQCTGRCIQEYRTHPVLVYDLQSKQNPPVKFEYFNIPSYCSCKNVSPK